MLIKATKDDVLKYMDFVYELALDQTKSGYPTFDDGIKTKDDFISLALRNFSHDREEILLFEFEGNVEGWINYYWIPEDKLVGIDCFAINKGTEEAIKELLEFLKNKFNGYEMYFGFPKCNIDATSYLERSGYQCIEEDYNNSFFFDDYTPIEQNEKILKITRETFNDFEILHKCKDEDMYWNCQRIFKAIDEWKIYVYYKNDKPVGVIYFTDLKLMLEIFGIDYIDGMYNDEVFKVLMIKALNEGKSLGAKYLTYFNEEGSQEVLLDLGFKCIGKYVCYLIKL